MLIFRLNQTGRFVGLVSIAMGLWLLASCHQDETLSESEETESIVEEKSPGEWTPGEQVEARGVLRYFRQDVKSPQAWSGHEFMAGEIPVIATSRVTSEDLRQLEGLEVLVSGTWNPGETWEPEGEEQFFSAPVFESEGQVTRGDGIKVLSVTRE